MQLDIALDDARDALERDERGDLPLGHREIVWAAIGPRSAGGPAHVRRARLAIAACRRGLALWEAERPGDAQAREVLELAPLALIGEVSENDAKTAAGRLWGRTENLTQIVGDPNRLSIGFACCKAVDVALYDEVFDPGDLDPERTSAGLDLFEVDAAYVVALAEAGGPPHAKGSDPERRRAFWRWWIEECGS